MLHVKEFSSHLVWHYLYSDLAARDAVIRLYRLYLVSGSVQHHFAPPLTKLDDTRFGKPWRKTGLVISMRVERRTQRWSLIDHQWSSRCVWSARLLGSSVRSRSKLLIGVSDLGGGPGPLGWSSVKEAKDLSCLTSSTPSGALRLTHSPPTFVRCESASSSLPPPPRQEGAMTHGLRLA